MGIFNRILLAYDGSACAKKALKTAEQFLMADNETTLLLLYVESTKGIPDTDSVEAFAISIEGEIRELFDDYQQRYPQRVQGIILAKAGPVATILEVSKKEACDLIIMGCNGKNGIKGYFGSVSYAVTQKSKVPVLIERE